MKLSQQQRKPLLEPNLLDRAVGYFAPNTALKMMRARYAITALTGGYKTRANRRQLSEWDTADGDADTIILPDLPELRSLSADLSRQNPIAAGAIKTKLTSVVGAGLTLNASIDREFLKMADAQADELELAMQREWAMFCQDCDVERQSTFAGLTRIVYSGVLERGDIFAILPMVVRPGSRYETKVQLIEADRVSNPRWNMDTNQIAGGVERDAMGAFTAIHVCNRAPGTIKATVSGTGAASEWTRIAAFGATTGRRNVLHVFDKLRPGQSRGVPDLAAIVEPLKQLGRFTDAEITAAVVAGLFTVFIKSQAGGTLAPMQPTADSGASASDQDVKLMAGGIVGLNPNEDVVAPTPGRPSDAFEPFVTAVMTQIGMALEIPREILMKQFESSYSAARAAINEFWKYVLAQRALLRDQWCQPVYEAVMEEAILKGRIAAPGFLADPTIRRAYLGATWVGPGRGQINEVDEVNAAVARYQHNFSTKAQETAILTGGDFEANVRTRRRENEAEQDAEVVPPAQPGAAPKQDQKQPQDSQDQQDAQDQRAAA